MADLYANYGALAAAEKEGVAYSRTAVTPAGWVQNLVLNPTLATGIANTTWFGSDVTRPHDTTQGFSGTTSIKVINTSTQNGGTAFYIEPVSNQQTVQMGIYVKLPTTGYSAGQIVWRSGTTTLKTQAITPPTTGAWTRFTGAYTLAAGQTCDNIAISFTPTTAGLSWNADAAMAEVGSTLHDYVDRARIGATWAAIAIHGGGIEGGSGEMAREISRGGGRMAYYEFAGLKSSGNTDLHVTSTNFDEPMAIAMVAGVRRCLSFHGYVGTDGVPETAIGGLDTDLVARLTSSLTRAGFLVTTAPSEIAGTDPLNICNRTATSAGVQLELSRALRNSFFPGGVNTKAVRDSGARTETFYRYASAVRAAYLGRGLMTMDSINVSRWALMPGPSSNVNLSATVATDVLAAGGGQFLALAARATDTNNCYLARLELSATQTVILTLRKRVAGTETLLVQNTTDLTHTANARFAIRFQVTGTTLRARVWPATAPEPTAWQLETTDTDLTDTGQVGMRTILSTAYTGALPVVASWADFDAASTVQYFAVTRAVNGISKPQTTSTDVRLAVPTTVAL
ncbi:poly-gamma-glutamate hydrolase family protein [Streptomyces sp. NBC_00842]|uniref:poly-gamma-glutamate hydrolase family protein n=1 Tax=Streptomyces sp. NBC_00842 TaxID=2975848 RepID=UPI003863608A|nr:poly-gamma-glutamate hydrolase family protein [Streptomyces sp. NBC_00842]